MKMTDLVATTVFSFVAVGIVACGDDSPGGSGGDADGSGTADTGATGAMTMMATSMAESGGQTMGASGDSSSSGGPPTEVLLSGEIRDFVVNLPIADAEISVHDMAGFDTTSNMDGEFTVGPLPLNTEVAILVAPAPDPDPMLEYIGSVVPEATTDMDRDDVQLSQVTRATIDSQIMQLENQMPAMPDPDAPIIIALLNNGTVLSDGNVTLDMQPAPVAGTYYAPDDMGVQQLDTQDIAFGLIPVVVYFNLGETAPGDITITASHPTTTCTIDHPSFPTLMNHITLVEISCS